MSQYKIVIDSCGELPEDLKADGHFCTVPLLLDVDGYQITDDETFNQRDFLQRVKACIHSPKSSCPSPERYMSAYEGEAEHVYVVTLSGKLSGSYNSAVLAADLYHEEHEDSKQIHVFNSKSASIGETLIGLKIQELEESGASFEEIVTEALELLNHYEIAQKFDIKFKNYLILDIYSSIMQIITLLNMILEEDYYLIYDRKEIVPEGMEDILKEPNHHETDIELNQYMDKAIKESIRHAYDTSPRYKDNFTFKDGYSIYQASYEDSNEYDINKIFPNFKRPMKQFNQTQVAFNMSLPKDEIISYISKIKDDYDNKETSYKTLNQLLYEEDTRTEEKLEHNQQNRYADDFFIYDYYTQCGENHENKLEIIQKKLSQYHGMKIENGRNNYTLIDYDEAITKMQSKSTTNNSNSLDDLVARFQENEHIIHYIETIKIIENRYESLKNAQSNLDAGFSVDMIEIDLKSAWDYLGEIMGDSYEGELVDKIFSNFCLGK